MHAVTEISRRAPAIGYSVDDALSNAMLAYPDIHDCTGNDDACPCTWHQKRRSHSADMAAVRRDGQHAGNQILGILRDMRRTCIANGNKELQKLVEAEIENEKQERMV